MFYFKFSSMCPKLFHNFMLLHSEIVKYYSFICLIVLVALMVTFCVLYIGINFRCKNTENSKINQMTSN